MKDLPYTITLSPDEMEAWIIFHSTSPLQFDQILTTLEAAGVVFGIDRFFLQDLATARQIGQPYQIAQGMPPEEGLEYFFTLPRDRKPRRLPDGRVDFHNLNTISNVIQQQILVTTIPPGESKSGKTVTGKEIPATGSEITLPVAGENVALSEDGNALIALINGHPMLSEDVLSVCPTYTLEGDVDFSVGNLTFVGTLVIRGDVRNGFSIKCAQDVIIHGIVDEADISAGGSISLHGNVFGKHKSRITSAGQVQGSYIDSTIVEAQDDILLTRGARYSHLHTRGSIVVQGKSGHIIGGSVQALEQIIAHDFGSENGVITHVEILSDLFDPETSGLVLRHIQAILEEDSALLDLPDDPKTLEKGYAAKEKIRCCQTALRDLVAYFENRLHILPLTPRQMGTIVATGTVYPGVTICIGGVSLQVTQPLTGVMFYKSKDMIKAQKLEIPLGETTGRDVDW